MKHLILGSNNQQVEFKTELAIDKIVELITASEKCLYLYADHLNPELLNHKSLAEECSRFINQSRYCKFGALVSDETSFVKGFHYLGETCKRIPSRLPIKKIPSDHMPAYSLLILSDDTGYLAIDRFEDGFIHCSNEDRVTNKKLKESFEELWRSAKEIEGMKSV